MITRGTGGCIAAAARQRRDGSRVERLAAYASGNDNGVLERAVIDLDRATDGGLRRCCSTNNGGRGPNGGNTPTCASTATTNCNKRYAFRCSISWPRSAIAARPPSAHAASPGRAYRGHVFWDADLFVLPFLAATHPQSARAMLEYRIARLPQRSPAPPPKVAKARGSRGNPPAKAPK